MATEPVAAPRGRLEVSTRLGGWPLVLVVTGVALLVLLVRLWIARRIETPWILLDEVIYSELAKSLASDGHPLVRGASISFPSLLYPATIAPAWLATDDVPTAYAIAKVINVVAMTAVTVPTYFWARRLVPARWALVAVALVLLMPSMLYTSALMSENAFFPLFVASAFACAAALERPTLWRQLLVFVPIALAIGVRVQAIVLLAVLPCAIAAKALFDARAGDPPRLRHAWATVRAMWPTLAVLAGGVLAFAVFERSRGRTVSSALGAYSFVTSGGYSFGDVRHWVALHFAELAFSVGVVPACALLVLVGLALAGRPMTEAERAFLAVASVSVLLVVLQVAAFASRFSLRIEERYMFPLAALLFIALVLWIARGMERPVVLTALSAFVPVILSLTLKLHELLGVQILSDTFALIPVWRVTQLLNGDASSAQTLLVFGTTVAAAAFALVPRRFAAFVLPLGVAAFLAFGSYPVYGAVRDYADALAAYAGGGDRDWVDDAVGAHTDVPYLYDASRIPGYDDMLLWQTEFWNRDLDTVVRLGPFVRDSLTEQVGSVDPVTGRITTGVGSPRYLVATNGLVVAGTPVDSKGGLTLYRVAQPLRLGRSVEGVYADGWMGASAAMTQFATLGDRPGTLRVRLSRSAWRGRDVPGHVTIRLGRAVRTATGVTIAKPLVQRRWTIHAGASRTFTLRTPRPPFRVEIGVDPTFSPSDYGLNDTRQLGAQVELDLAPR